MRIRLLAVAVPLLACSPGGSRSGGSAASLSEAPRGSHLPGGAPPARPAYYGGRVLSNVKVYQVLYGQAQDVTYQPFVSGAPLGAFYAAATSSPYLDWLYEYDTDILDKAGQPGTGQAIGRGTFAGQVEITPSQANGGKSLQDSDIQAELQAQLAAGTLPPPDENTLYLVNLPEGVTATVPVPGGSATTCKDVCSYHSAFTLGGMRVPYGVLPDMSAGSGCDDAALCGSGVAFDVQTTAASQALIGAITDAESGPTNTAAAPVGWYYPTGAQDISQLCNLQQDTFVGADGVTYTVQKAWSVAANACVSKPTATTFDFFIGLPATVALAIGSKTTVAVTTTLLQAAAQSLSLGVSGLPPGVTGTFSPPSVTAGQGSTLTLTSTGATAAGSTSFEVNATGGGLTRENRASLVTGQVVLQNMPPDQSVEASSRAGAVATWAAPTAVEGGTPAPVTCTPASGSTFPFGTTRVTCATQDQKGTGSFQITVADTRPPVLTVPPDITVRVTSGAGAQVSYSVTAEDVVDGSRPVTCTPASGRTFPLGTTQVQCSSSDTRNNIAHGSFSVLVRVEDSRPLSSKGCSAGGGAELELAAFALGLWALRRRRSASS